MRFRNREHGGYGFDPHTSGMKVIYYCSLVVVQFLVGYFAYNGRLDIALLLQQFYTVFVLLYLGITGKFSNSVKNS
jgi:hypothetical protein